MTITLTDRDGVRFDVDTRLIDEVNSSPKGTEIVLGDGERISCTESALYVMQSIVRSEYGGAV